MTPEQRARVTIDTLLQAAGWHVCNLAEANIRAHAVAAGVNVNYDVYRIKTELSKQGAKVDKGFWQKTQDKATRRKTAWQLDDDFEYQSEELDRAVQTPDQIRTLREKLGCGIELARKITLCIIGERTAYLITSFESRYFPESEQAFFEFGKGHRNSWEQIFNL